MYEKLHRKKNVFDVCRPNAQKEVRELRMGLTTGGAVTLLQLLPQQLFNLVF